MNEDQRAFWNGPGGQSWVAMQERLTAMLAPVTEAIVASATPVLGEHVLDVGCGSGDTTLAFAARVAPGGRARGIDISADLLALARRRAAETRCSASFVEGDAATLPPDAPVDLLVSRFGVMFFDDPAAAFANLRRHTRDGGRLVFACWQAPRANPWATVPMQALAPLLPPAPPADPHAPGPFAFADAERVTALLTAAGWRDVAVQPFTFAMVVGEGPDAVTAAVDYLLTIGPAARAVREAGVGPAAREMLAAALAPHAVDGSVSLPASVWLLTAAA